MGRNDKARRGLGIAAAATAVVALLTPAAAAADSATFLPTGAEQTFVVPAGVTSIHAIAIGGRGGDGANGGKGGFGAVVSADLTVTPGQTLYVEVGGNGVSGAAGGAGGFNGGGNGGDGGSDDGGGGGGATDIRTAPRIAGVSLSARLLVAGGGGGGGGDNAGPGSFGDGGTAGSTPTAGAAGFGGGGEAGTSTEGGESANVCGGSQVNGQLGTGGSGESAFLCGFPFSGGGGGGGGLYGGGGGGASSVGGGGGAGSSGFGVGIANATIQTDVTAAPSVLLVYTPLPTGGQSNGGSGATSAPPPTPVQTPATVCKVPKLAGRSLKGAKRALRNNNCKPGAVNRRTRRARTVVGQGRKAGKSFPAGTEVSITLGGSG